MEINIENYLARFKIYYPKSLFPPDFKMLAENKCPICFHKLYWSVDGKFGRCKSVRKDKFKISRAVFEKLTYA